MELDAYFQSLIDRVENSDAVTNGGKDKEGFYLPTRSILLQKLHILRDLHAKKNAKPMVKDAWAFVVENLPPDWLVLDKNQKTALKEILA